ncbi:DNA-directed RNA polymerases II and IV subunit 5A-like [Malus domestica]|uniref:DNA-directed RNA polymerases II and IV subunit 5A-like n=1 Tax=Malus domestica TaxID=3750 RepID=UPI0010AA0ADA|nr:DNA-directed RNA polymerases II and IV subunit 5A-like [Malus domestica]
MVLTEEEITRLYRVRKNVMQMLKDRYRWLWGSRNRRHSYWRSQNRRALILVLVFQIYVFFPDEPKLGVKTMKTYTNRMKSENVFR